MEKDFIIRLLSDPAELDKISLEDLQALVNKYPFFSQLQVLLEKKQTSELLNGTYQNGIEPDTKNPDNSNSGLSSNIIVDAERPHKKEENKEGEENSDSENETFKEEDEYDENNENDFEEDEYNENEKHDRETERQEFDELEEENTQLPFDDDTLKYSNNIGINTVFGANQLDVAAKDVEQEAGIFVEPVLIVEEDTARLLTKAGISNAHEADDLTLIEYINTDAQNTLYEHGIYTYKQIKKLIEEGEQALLSKITGVNISKVAAWPRMSSILYANKYQKLLIEKIGVARFTERNSLQKINGIGSTLESKLNGIGILNCKQLALLEKNEVEIVTELIDYFPGRIARDEWVEQAKRKTYDQSSTYTTQNSNGTGLNDELTKLKQKIETHKELRKGIVNQTTLSQKQDGTLLSTNGDQPKESFRDWLAKMNKGNTSEEEKKNQLVNDLTRKPQI